MYLKLLFIFLTLTHLNTSLSEGTKAHEQKEYKKAYDQFIKSAREGMVAKYNIGLMYEVGKGIEKDINKAIYFYTLSANDGYSFAQNKTGAAYFKGIGVKKNLKKAIHYYNLSAKQNNKEAIEALKIIDNIAYLTIRSDVYDDKVYINDKYMGKSKLTTYLLPNTTYNIRVEKEGHPTYSNEVVLKPKENKTIRAILMKK